MSLLSIWRKASCSINILNIQSWYELTSQHCELLFTVTSDSDWVKKQESVYLPPLDQWIDQPISSAKEEENLWCEPEGLVYRGVRVCLGVCVFACLYLWQAEGDVCRRYSMMGLDCKHILVVWCSFHRHMSAEKGNKPCLSFLDDFYTTLMGHWSHQQ